MRSQAEELKHNQEAQASTIAKLALKATISSLTCKIESKLHSLQVKLDLRQAEALGALAKEAQELEAKLERYFHGSPTSQAILEALQALLAQVEALQAREAELDQEEEAEPLQEAEQAEQDLGEALGKAEAYPKLEAELEQVKQALARARARDKQLSQAYLEQAQAKMNLEAELSQVKQAYSMACRSLENIGESHLKLEQAKLAQDKKLELLRAQVRSQADMLLGLELFLQALGMKQAWLEKKASFTPYDRSPQAQAQFLIDLYLSIPKSF